MAYRLALAATLALSLLGSTVSALPSTGLESRKASGINCDGSARCISFNGDIQDILTKVNAIPKGKTFNSGDKLACAGNEIPRNSAGIQVPTGEQGGGLCAMIGHNTPSYTVGDSTNGQSNSAADVIEDLIYHGCKACGTAPTNRVGNDLSGGSIVVNYVSHVCKYSLSNPCGP